jgi:hypothetical protein
VYISIFISQTSSTERSLGGGSIWIFLVVRLQAEFSLLVIVGIICSVDWYGRCYENFLMQMNKKKTKTPGAEKIATSKIHGLYYL